MKYKLYIYNFMYIETAVLQGEEIVKEIFVKISNKWPTNKVYQLRNVYMDLFKWQQRDSNPQPLSS